MKDLENNFVQLTGEIISDFQYSHEVRGEKFYTTELVTTRYSGFADYVPLLVSERLVDIKADWKGQFVNIIGQFRSFNRHDEDKNRLILQVFVKDLEVCEENVPVSNNEIYLRGYICKEPVYRKTPREREIADVLIAVHREYGKSDYIPCIAWGRNARFVGEMEVGTYVALEGRVQSRDYVKRLEDGTEEVRTAFEVSVSKIDN